MVTVSALKGHEFLINHLCFNKNLIMRYVDMLSRKTIVYLDSVSCIRIQYSHLIMYTLI